METTRQSSSEESFFNQERYRLTEQERSQIDALVVKLGIYDNNSILQEFHNRLDAEQALFALGPKILPYLREALSGSLYKKFLYTLFQDALAEAEDLELVLDSAGSEGIYNNSDTSAAAHVSDTLLRLIYSIRTENPANIRLIEISNKLTSILDSTGIDRNVLFSYLEALAATGTPGTRSYIDNARLLPHEKAHFLSFLSSPRNFANRQRYRFVTLADITHDQAIDQEPTHSHAETQRAEKTAHESASSASKKASKAVKIVRSYLEDSPLQTVRPALNLHIYNFLSDHPQATDADLTGELDRYQKIIEKETEAAKEKGLPTVGVEIEVPSNFFPFVFYDKDGFSHKPQKIMDLLAMGLTPKQEFTNNSPTEIEFPPTHSAATQNRMIFELRKAGLVPIDNTFASMHINIGGTKKFNSHSYDSENRRVRAKIIYPVVAEAISDILTFAFIPAGRVASRQSYYMNAWEIKEAHSLTMRVENALSRFRVEFRTPRVVGKNTYRLIHEVQVLSVLLSRENTEYDSLRNNFLQRVLKLLQKYHLYSGIPHSDKKQAAEVLRKEYQKKLRGEQNLISDARSLMTEFVLAIQKRRMEK